MEPLCLRLRHPAKISQVTHTHTHTHSAVLPTTSLFQLCFRGWGSAQVLGTLGSKEQPPSTTLYGLARAVLQWG